MPFQSNVITYAAFTSHHVLHAAIFNGDTDGTTPYYHRGVQARLFASRILMSCRLRSQRNRPLDVWLWPQGVTRAPTPAVSLRRLALTSRSYAKGGTMSAPGCTAGLAKGVSAFQDYIIVDPLLTFKLDKTSFKLEPLPVGSAPWIDQHFLKELPPWA